MTHYIYDMASFAIAICLIYLKIRPYRLTSYTQKMRNMQFLVFLEKFGWNDLPRTFRAHYRKAKDNTIFQGQHQEGLANAESN